jgi:oligosaccharide repeat unit polymerase
MQLSSRLSSGWLFWGICALLCVSFIGGALLSTIMVRYGYRSFHITDQTARSSVMLVLWVTIGLSLLEIAVEGYIPIITLMLGADISHFDFGVASIHGLILAAFSAVGTYFFGLFLVTKNRRYLWLALIPIAYSIMMVSRKMTTVCFLQYTVVYLMITRPRPSMLLRTVLVMLVFIVFFGIVGDLRGSGGSIDQYGGMGNAFNFPGGSGFRWVYLYLTTPIENLHYTVVHFPSEGNILPEHTFGGLLPSFISNMINPVGDLGRFDTKAIERYWLESAIFNISTGFNSPYLDYGWIGMILLAAMQGFLSIWAFLRSRSLIGLCVTAGLISASMLSVFSNNYGNLNFAGQFPVFLFMTFNVGLRSHAPHASYRTAK